MVTGYRLRVVIGLADSLHLSTSSSSAVDASYYPISNLSLKVVVHSIAHLFYHEGINGTQENLATFSLAVLPGKVTGRSGYDRPLRLNGSGEMWELREGYLPWVWELSWCGEG